MTISLGNALKTIKADENWVKKLVIGGFVTIAVIAASSTMEMKGLSAGLKCVGLALYIVIGGFLSGFLLSSANKQINENTDTLTEWSEPNILIKGIKFIFSYLIYSIVLVILGTIFATVLTIIACIILGVIYYLFNLLLHLNETIGSFILGTIFTTFFIIYMLYFMQFLNAGIVCYYKNLKFRDIMAFKKQFRIIKDNQHLSWTLIGKEILYALLFTLIIVIACVTIIGILLLPFICFAAYIVGVNLYTQYAREIEVGKYLE